MFSAYVVWYLFLAGAGAGCFVIVSCWTTAAAIGQNAGSVRLPDGSRLGFVAAPVLLVFASLFLLVDLGSPERVGLVFLHPFDSIISTGAFFVACLVLLSSVVAAVALTGRALPKGFAIIGALGGMLLSFGVMAYSGVLLSSMVAIDFWRSLLIPALFVVSSLTTGLSVIVCLNILIEGVPPRSPFPYRLLAIVGGLLEAALLIAFLVGRYGFSPVSRLSCTLLFTGELAFPFWFGLVFMGFVLPFVSQVLSLRMPSIGLTVISSAGVLVAGCCLRYCLVNAAVFPTAMLGSFL